jgi:hypothetical protein
MQIQPAPHEGDFNLIFTEHGLSPFYALESLRAGYDGWKEHGKPTAEVDMNGETWYLALDYSDSGFDTWENPKFDIQTVREYSLYFVSENSPKYDGEPADQAERVKGGYVNISPRWPGITSDGEPVSVPDYGKPYINARMQASNIPHEDYHDLLKRIFSAFDLTSKYVRNPHEDSNINDLAYYVRPKREASGPLFAPDGPIARTHTLIQGDRSGYRKHVEDHRKIPGYYVTATIEDRNADTLIRGHSLGKEIKHYYPQSPKGREKSDPLYHPKFEVSFMSSVTDETLRFTELESARRELEEAILNCLDWCELATGADSPIWCESDTMWPVEDTHKSRRFVKCPLPEIENQQEATVMKLWSNMNETDLEVCDLLLTDGGKPSMQEAADKTGNSYRTIQRVTDRLEGLIDHTYGEMEFQSKKIQQELKQRVRAAKDRFESDIESATMDLADASEGRETSAWDRWRRNYDVSVSQEDFRKLLRMGWSPESREEAERILKSGLLKMEKGRRRKFEVAGEAIVRLADGSREEIDLEHLRIGKRGGNTNW